MGWRQCFVQASHRMRLFLRWIKGLARMEHLGNTFTRRTLYRRMKQKHHRHVYGTGRSSLFRGSSFLYRTACREVNTNDQIIIRKEDYKHDRSSIQQHRCTAHIQRILEERRAAPTVCTSHNVLETRCTASRSR